MKHTDRLLKNEMLPKPDRDCGRVYRQQRHPRPLRSDLEFLNLKEMIKNLSSTHEFSPNLFFQQYKFCATNCSFYSRLELKYKIS